MEVVRGSAVSDLLERVRRNPAGYREVVFCAPFVDESSAAEIRDAMLAALKHRCAFRLITRSGSARSVLAKLPSPSHLWSRAVQVNDRLHAKVYLALARVNRESEAIVTSANLTKHGRKLNEELGIRITGRTELERHLLAIISNAIYNLLRRN